MADNENRYGIGGVLFNPQQGQTLASGRSNLVGNTNYLTPTPWIQNQVNSNNGFIGGQTMADGSVRDFSAVKPLDGLDGGLKESGGLGLKDGLAIAGTVGNLFGAYKGYMLEKDKLRDTQARTQLLREKRDETADFKKGLAGALS